MLKCEAIFKKWLKNTKNAILTKHAARQNPIRFFTAITTLYVEMRGHFKNGPKTGVIFLKHAWRWQNTIRFLTVSAKSMVHADAMSKNG